MVRNKIKDDNKLLSIESGDEIIQYVNEFLWTEPYEEITINTNKQYYTI